MNEPFQKYKLESILKLKKGNARILNSRESNTIEFKESFNWNNKAKYAKTMSAFANRDGGYIIFGIKDSPHEVIGIISDRFENTDEEKISAYLNDVFSPEINWEKTVFEFDNVKIGFIYVYESKSKPVICTKNDEDIKEAEVYYRYRGRTEKIKYPEMRSLIANEIEKEKNLWMKYLGKISKSGVSNIALLDTKTGKLDNGANAIYLDEKLLKEIEFIKEGEFNEITGAKTLKIIGEVKNISTSALLPARTQIKGMRTRDIIEVVLFGKLHENTSASEYIEHLINETSIFMPIHVFRLIGKMTYQEIGNILKALKTTKKSQKSKLLSRLEKEKVFKIGTIDSRILKNGLMFSEVEDFESYIVKNNANKSVKRTLLVNLLKSDNFERITDFSNDYTAEILAAITHLEKYELVKIMPYISDYLLTIYDTRFNEVANDFRWVICHIDKTLYSEA